MGFNPKLFGFEAFEIQEDVPERENRRAISNGSCYSASHLKEGYRRMRRSLE
jgi:hypothetical protein